MDSRRRFIRGWAFAGLIAPVMWGIISLFPDRYPFAPLSASKAFDLVTVALWPWFLISAMSAAYGVLPVVMYVVSALINALWYATVGQLLLAIVHRHRKSPAKAV